MVSIYSKKQKVQRLVSDYLRGKKPKDWRDDIKIGDIIWAKKYDYSTQPWEKKSDKFEVIEIPNNHWEYFKVRKYKTETNTFYFIKKNDIVGLFEPEKTEINNRIICCGDIVWVRDDKDLTRCENEEGKLVKGYISMSDYISDHYLICAFDLNESEFEPRWFPKKAIHTEKPTDLIWSETDDVKLPNKIVYEGDNYYLTMSAGNEPNIRYMNTKGWVATNKTIQDMIDVYMKKNRIFEYAE